MRLLPWHSLMRSTSTLAESMSLSLNFYRFRDIGIPITSPERRGRREKSTMSSFYRCFASRENNPP